MDRFVSHYLLRLDAKGRVSVPAAFRAVLARDGFDGLYCYPAFDRPALDAGGNALLREIEALVAGFPAYSVEREQFSLAFYGTSETLKIDGEGRVVLTDTLKAHTGINDAVLFVGLGHKFRILGARPLSRGAYGGHWQGPRLQTKAGNPDRGGKTARSAGMITGGDSSAVAGGLARHIPVLAGRVAGWLAVRDGGVYVDATFGAGGYTRAILATPGTRVIGIDRDERAIAAASDIVKQAAGRLQVAEGRFSELAAITADHGAAEVDGVVFDLGVSSMQIDEPARGFSFRLDGPLDMRMGGDGPSAADVVARAGERDLAAIFTLGEERHARAIARAIVRARDKVPITTTLALAEIVVGIVRPREGAIHPATRAFQALRIFVNEELTELAHGLAAAERVLKPGGRLVVVAFHSLEDRIVKTFLAERSRAPASSRHRPEVVAPPTTFRPLTRRPETPDEAEIAANPRARSAKLRAAERTEATARSSAVETFLPPLPLPGQFMRGAA